VRGELAGQPAVHLTDDHIFAQVHAERMLYAVRERVLGERVSGVSRCLGFLIMIIRVRLVSASAL
jgi:hypothetical protein